jgi:hypothetical protein
MIDSNQSMANIRRAWLGLSYNDNYEALLPLADKVLQVRRKREVNPKEK